MINEKRVHLMTQMALYDKHEQKEYEIAEDYTRKEYLSHTLAVSVIAGTLFYAFVVAVIMVLVFGTLHVETTPVFVVLVVLLIAIGYVLHLYIYIRSRHQKAKKQYKRSSAKLKQMKQYWKQLDDLYEEENAKEAPEGWNS